MSLPRLLMAGVVVLSTGVLLPRSCSEHVQPDVFLLLVDTLRADHLGVYGYERPTSPELDRFASSALVFRNVFAPASWTLPSVGSLMTSTYPSLHGLRAKAGAQSITQLRPGLTTLTEAFRAAGYRTAAVVTNPWMVRRHGLQRGFDQYHLTRGPAPAARVHEIARELVDLDDPRPLFLYLHYMDVHPPYARSSGPEEDPLGPVPERLRRPLEAAELQVMPRQPPELRTLEDWVRAYDRGIRAWDRAFGEWVAWLEARGGFEDQIVAVVSDHGVEIADHGRWGHGHALYQEQLGVPWILKVPGHPGGVVHDEPVSLIDVAPTLLSAAGLAPVDGMMGRDVLGGPPAPDRALLAETDLGSTQDDPAPATHRALRRGGVKLVVGGEKEVCFDLVSDPFERDPLRSSRGACGDAPELEAWAERLRRLGDSLGAADEVELGPAEREQLRRLGYVEEAPAQR
ncbi:MAG: sulfatase [Myxococcota bacterium]